MSHTLATLHHLLDETTGPELPLPPELAAFHGPLRLPAPADRPHLFANFVSTLDGVVALGEPGTGGDEISGDSGEDHALMGLLRAVADVIIVGAGTLRAFPRHVWTPEAIHAPLTEAYRRVRDGLGRGTPALTVLVSASGDLDLSLPVFTGARAPVAVVTTPAGAERLRGPRAGSLDLRVVNAPAPLSAADILEAVAPPPGARILLECGPHLLSTFFEGGRVDELFLTVAAQVAGRRKGAPRLGLVEGAVFLPDRPAWGQLLSVKRAGSLLFLRYRFPNPGAK
jgi:riboflavin biosynthesis pyrimidine reductase